MKLSKIRSIAVALVAAVLLAHTAPVFAQQAAAQQPPAATPMAAPSAEQPATAPETTGATQALPASGTTPNGSVTPGLAELSPWSMFMQADIVVKAVMVGLALASMITWTILIAKKIELGRARLRLRSALKQISEARSMSEAQLALGDKTSPLSMLLAAALREARVSAGLASDEGIKERAVSSFSEIVRAESRHMRHGMGFLATIGATAPFIGLFGTVWGIMNSFIGISKSQTTNLAVVAPGIAEALLATAIGLVAAIPAVIIYNHFSREIKVYLEMVARASGAALRLLSRDLDRSHGSGRHSRAAE
ncbi:tonB-system energizer ExbB [Rhodopseudomonas palustris]|uniref:tonB-system energizer ExbB n=1 Tax=Rhodopseudomonas palustris TaxID=1076 RepID=UPI002ACD3275|nr:tonB-system energizer ExbB [Rhodopseudomonas palustris]WQH01447.1 tonB-system energizer ExbB [Rhodopseudomonas palustris]